MLYFAVASGRAARIDKIDGPVMPIPPTREASLGSKKKCLFNNNGVHRWLRLLALLFEKNIGDFSFF